MVYQSLLLSLAHFIVDVAAVGSIDADSLALVVEVRVVLVLLDLDWLQQSSHTPIGQYDILLGVVDLDDGGRVVSLGLGLVIHFRGGWKLVGSTVNLEVVLQSADDGCASLSVAEPVR